MTKNETILKAQTYFDDMTELSLGDLAELYDKIYSRICNSRPWEFTKATGTGTTSTSVPYISLPNKFRYFTQNANYTTSAVASSRPVVFVGTNYDKYEVVSWSDRRQYRDQDGYVYVDYPNLRLYFTLQPNQAKTVEFDYHKAPDALTTNDEPAFPAEFHDMIYHAMCVDQFIILQSDKAKSYAPEHQQAYDKYMADLQYWNANLVQL